MKYKTTKRFLNANSYRNIVNAPYCSMQYLLRGQNASSYCAGVYGWACDNYQITVRNTKKEIVESVIVSTGYSPAGNKDNALKYEYKKLNKYEQQAQKIACSTLNYEQKDKKINKLLNKFLFDIISNQ